jgi:hypothetical protein
MSTIIQTSQQTTGLLIKRFQMNHHYQCINPLHIHSFIHMDKKVLMFPVQVGHNPDIKDMIDQCLRNYRHLHPLHHVALADLAGLCPHHLQDQVVMTVMN